MKIDKQNHFKRIHLQDGITQTIQTELDRHGGAKARKWRKDIAMLADSKTETTTKTLSFPLEMQVPITHFGTCDQHYNTIEGTQEASLFGLLIRTHLCGLSLYGNASDAQTARHNNFPDTEFRLAIEQIAPGVEAVKFVPSVLYNLFKSVPKNSRTNGSPEFTLEDIQNRIHKNVFGKSINDETPASMLDLLSTCAQEILRHTQSYKELAEKRDQILVSCLDALRAKHQQIPALVLPTHSDSDIDMPLAYTGVVKPLEASETDGSSEAYWLHHIIACMLSQDPLLKAPKVKELLLSANDNALSNLFGVQLWSAKDEGWLRTLTAEEYLALLGMPSDRLCDVQRLMSSARALPRPKMFNKKNYADFRKILAGKLKSWVSNYLARLQTLEDQVQSLGSMELPVESVSVQPILDGLKITIDELQQMHLERKQHIQSAKMNMAVLMGKSQASRPIAAAQGLESDLAHIEAIHGTFRMVLNQINQRLAESADAALSKWKSALSAAENHDLFRLPHITGGSPDVEQTLVEINRQLANLYEQWHTFSLWVQEQSGGNWAACLARMAQQERARARSTANIDFEVLAERRFLDQMERLTRRVSEPVKDKIFSWLLPLITDSGPTKAKTIANKLRFNAMGRFYKSPWSSARHQALLFDRLAFRRFHWIEALTALSNEIEAAFKASPTANSFQDHLEVKRALTACLIMGLPDEIQRSDLKHALDLDALSAHPRLRVALMRDSLSPEDMSTLLASLSSQLAKMRFFVRRKDFIVRHKFSAIKQDALLYVPKDVAWAMPHRYLEPGSPIGGFLRQYSTDHDFANPINVRSVCQAFGPLAPHSGNVHFLQQLPHDWYLPLPWQLEVGNKVNGLRVDKDCQTKPDKKLTWHQGLGARLCGPSSFKQPLTEILVGRKKINEWMLILDWHHDCELVWMGHRPKIHARLRACAPRVALPLTEQMPATSDPSLHFYDRLVAIDLGEKQIGYAVFDVPKALQHLSQNQAHQAAWALIEPCTDPDSGQPLTGVIGVTGVRSLIRAVKTHRSRQASNSKLRQNFDTHLQQLRESVCSEVTQKIDALCRRYKAFPVLEHSVSNFQTGSRQLDLVYGDVVRTYTYSQIPAHGKARQEYWMGADRWTHRYLMQKKFDEETRTRSGPGKPLSLFPGAGVSAAHTSQTCIHCGRNPFLTLQTMEKEGVSTLTADHAGEIQLTNGRIGLFTGANHTDNEKVRAYQQRANLAMNKPMSPGAYSVAEVKHYMRMSVRQKHPNVRSGASSQGWYQCVYKPCSEGFTHAAVGYHADEGAAINIGRKFLTLTVDAPASLGKLKGKP